VASDYPAIRSANQQRYDTDIALIGPMLLADRDDARTHFIYELLQNTEDGLARRTNWNGADRSGSRPKRASFASMLMGPGGGVSFEEFAAECDFAMDQILDREE
jgi:hypothetical protein